MGNNFKGVNLKALIFIWQQHLININFYNMYLKIPEII